MKTRFLIGLLIIGIIFISGCIEQKPTIEQGIYGKVTLTTGNCMPPISLKTCAKTIAIERDIYVYGPKILQDFKKYTSYLNNTDNFITKIRSNKKGFYEVELPPGTYSLFVEDNGEQYCDYYDDPAVYCQVILRNETKEFNIDINKVVQ